MSETRALLYKLVRAWSDLDSSFQAELSIYEELLAEQLFHADLRYGDYAPLRDIGDSFAVRLKDWLTNTADARLQKALFRVLRHLTFVDDLQMRSLYRDAYRRIVVPWIHGDDITVDELLAPDYEQKNITLLQNCTIFAITISFDLNKFAQVNGLFGIAKPTILGEEVDKVNHILKMMNNNPNRIVIFEDFVGTGKQAGGIVRAVKEFARSNCPILFVPLIILENGLAAIQEALSDTNIVVEPALVINSTSCISVESIPGEDSDFPYIRALIKATGKVVCEQDGLNDDPPGNPFGYKGCGAFVVTCHNAPNNTLPLIHHQSPDWHPLFRRVHHRKGGTA